MRTEYMNLQRFAEGDSIDESSLIQRSGRVAFMNIGTKEAPVYKRMQGFSEFNESKSTESYDRQYVDEATQRSDVKSYATEISYSFDRYSPFAVHDKLAHITDDELRGSDTHVQILTVDTFITTGDNARLREWAVIPDTSGDGTDALVYSGTLRAAGDFTACKATVSADGMTATIGS